MLRQGGRRRSPPRPAARRVCKNYNKQALADHTGEKARPYASFKKLAGLDWEPVQLAVFAKTELGHRLGSKILPETLFYSVVVAVNMLWLVARAHGVGMG